MELVARLRDAPKSLNRCSKRLNAKLRGRHTKAKLPSTNPEPATAGISRSAANPLPKPRWPWPQRADTIC